MTIVSSDVYKRVVDAQYPCTNIDGSLHVDDPDGYSYTVVDNSAFDGSMGHLSFCIRIFLT